MDRIEHLGIIKKRTDWLQLTGCPSLKGKIKIYIEFAVTFEY